MSEHIETKLRDIIELAPTPYDLINAMCDGLQAIMDGRYSNGVEYVIDMGTYGESCETEEEIAEYLNERMDTLPVVKPKPTCYGCAATWTMMQLGGVVYNTSNIDYRSNRAACEHFHTRQLEAFEDVIDTLRLREQYGLFDMYKLYGFRNPERSDAFESMRSDYLIDKTIEPLVGINPDNLEKVLTGYRVFIQKHEEILKLKHPDFKERTHWLCDLKYYEDKYPLEYQKDK